MPKQRANSVVWCKLPNAGLGNQLFPLIKSFVFARLNNLPVIVTNYHQIKVGPYLRREKVKRQYRNYFNFQKNIIGEWKDKRKVQPRMFLRHVKEPSLSAIEHDGNTLFSFHEIPHWSDFFCDLKPHRNMAIELFYELLSPAIKERLQLLPSPDIGLHVRMGDFRKLAAGEDFAKLGAVRTPERYFVETVNTLRLIRKELRMVSVFSDGRKNDFSELSSLPHIKFVEGNSDIIDLVLLSRSKLIVASAGSTFSYWAGFLSESPVLLHPDHIHNRLRMGGAMECFEGSLEEYKSIIRQGSVNTISSTN